MSHSVNPDKYHYGLDAEIQSKLAAKFSPQRAAQAQAWLEALVGYQFPGGFHESLKSGVILCEALNRIAPGSVKKITKLKSPFKMRENIVAYLEGCKRLGVKEHDNFVTQDLFEGDNLGQVVDQIFALGSVAQSNTSFKGPYIGVKLAQQNKRNFTAAQLNTKGAVPLLSQGSYGVQDDSHNPSLDRQIIKNVTGVKASGVPTRLHSYHNEIDKSSKLDKIIRNPDQLQKNRGGPSAAAAAVSSSKPPQPASGGAKFCGNCGAKRSSAAAKFCGECGTKF
eukprot:TRINITY_DN65758_c9_g3_i3.p2 TRINITY_DN65758_c9_g3~~TRINITY_DN65758_c9_g3_i3.p2  ORF type:complete len:318 (+),score=140.80 TRINITY_DN65758_c9_g3_i3:115-954(+)